MLPGMELMNCPNMAVPREVMHHVVRVESSYNPYAIGVVGGRLVRQPRSLPEALSTVRMLEERGYNFSLGLAQVNRYNLTKYGLHSYDKAFQPCANLVAGSQILAECYRRSQDWGKSFSCYYSGDFKTGYRHGYVQKVYASMRRGRDAQAAGVAPIQVIDRATRRTAAARPAPAQAPVVLPYAGGQAASLAERRGMRPSVPAQPPQPLAASQAADGMQAAAMQAQLYAQAAPYPAVQAASAQPSADPAIWTAAVQQQALSPPTPVRLTATRVGQPAAVAAPVPAPDDSDNAFVF